jgi:hypothetical protein
VWPPLVGPQAPSTRCVSRPGGRPLISSPAMQYSVVHGQDRGI